MKIKPNDMLPKEIEEKMKELKTELLKQPTKRKSIKRQLARLITVKNRKVGDKKQ